ncbi:peptide chain release factor 3 [Buchnera aphidicola]|jgi:peptide chain release factor 3|uniref:Peptide chain release factor 3 n=1 Tax=Buchnera aphidicola subsp. Schizaphis graminum (strain Sg) TaxID=198804 RepID=RF3_BUCAP|nr:peptide chain release factor 3 [Buchnera aphidicola]Q8K935.1 RecName: Full=Peptide chain release factor 3; Short=RF-3 [Buchnera aphidicola str. Sg (Schizaphis graminum)]AAM68066.1 peptide chain release factor 3 (RF-3) [Buchnera aphidicola str. Sg (Schizaphis graminum)]AWI49446.1 peptide chain release factor 3 [Buchnera aphidicola (Schizaphis graminum)]
MFNINHQLELSKRRTFAIISHPDAGKTTVTEKMLLLGKVIRTSGTIKARGNGKYAKSDWMNIEKKRGISITTSVMQFTYKNTLMNLLDTPGHEDFSEDTYRILTAVDCCLLIIDAAKGIEDRTKKLINVSRLHNTPVITFINKLDRDSREAIEILDEIEKELSLDCIPITWPISCGKNFKGICHIHDKIVNLYQKNIVKKINFNSFSSFLNEHSLKEYLGADLYTQLHEELKLAAYVYPKFSKKKFLKGDITPVLFGSALNNFGIDHILESLIKWAPSPIYRVTKTRKVEPEEKKFTGFVFKIQANMDLKHRDRIAFMRIVSGKYKKGIKLRHVRMKKDIIVSDAFSFLAGDRFSIEHAYPGDVIGIHNHGTIKIGDTFTEGEEIKFVGIPSFAPEVFRRIFLKNPLQQKKLKKGLSQLSEEGAIQVFRPMINNSLILGAIGILQFDVVIERLKIEYKIDAIYERVNISLARWIRSKNKKIISDFINKNKSYLALDISNQLIYLAPNKANLAVIKNIYNNIFFEKTREQ